MIASSERRSVGEILRYLERCRDVAFAAARLHYAYARIFASIPTVAVLFRKTAKEEENHAGQFQLAMAGQAAMVRAPKLPMDEVLRAIASVETVIERAERSTPSIVEALRTAVAFEESLEKFHVDNAVVFAGAGREKLFHAIMAADKSHLSDLKRMLAVYEKPAKS